MIPLGFDHLWSKDRAAQNAAFGQLMAETEEPVDWAYAVWGIVVRQLANEDNHNRAIAAQLLASLAKSDPERRILVDFDALFAVTDDEKFVTARHALQSAWKIGVAGPEQHMRVVAALSAKFRTTTHKNATLIRYDVLEALRKIAEATGDETIRPLAMALIESETDPRYQKKYRTLWR